MPTIPGRKVINLSVYRGEARRIRVNIYDPDDALDDISAWEFECKVRDKDGTLVGLFDNTSGLSEDADGGPIDSPSTGVIDLVFNETWTLAADVGFYYYDLLITPDDRRPFFPFGGVLNIKQPVTRP
jgi:hypothetical protein